MKHKTFICVHGYVVDGGVPEGGVELNLNGIQFGNGKQKSIHIIPQSANYYSDSVDIIPSEYYTKDRLNG